MSAMVSGLAGAVVAFALFTISERNQRAATVLGDWHLLRPGWLINGLIIGTTALAAFEGYFLLNGGSTLPDAGTQNLASALLLALFVTSAIYVAWTTYGRTIMWKGNELRVASAFGGEAVMRIPDVTTVEKSERRGGYRVCFRDGSCIWLSAHLNGSNELIAKLPRTAFRHQS